MCHYNTGHVMGYTLGTRTAIIHYWYMCVCVVSGEGGGREGGVGGRITHVLYLHAKALYLNGKLCHA